MTIFILGGLLVYAIDILLVGISFQAICNKYEWNFSFVKSFTLLFIIFAVLESYLWPFVYSLDATITIGNKSVVSLLEIPADYPLIDFIDLGLFELFLFSFEAVIANFVGNKILKTSKTKTTAKNAV